MGNAASLADAEKEKVQNLLTALNNKRDEFIARVQLSRGEGDDTNREIGGGRSVSRISEVRIQNNEGVDPGIKDAIASFITAAQGGDKAKNAAVDGATALLGAGLDALFGATSGSGLEKTGFVVLFLNFSFVRVDYYVYTYSVSGKKWGEVANESGSCYVADIAILDPTTNVKIHEVDYLLGQALSLPDSSPDDSDEFEAILRLKIRLTESIILSRLLQKEDLSFEELTDITKKLIETERTIEEAFNSLSSFDNTDYIPVEEDSRLLLEEDESLPQSERVNNPGEDKVNVGNVIGGVSVEEDLKQS